MRAQKCDPHRYERIRVITQEGMEVLQHFNTLKPNHATIEELLEAGTDLIEKGLPIIPTDGKRPIGTSWQNPPFTVDRLKTGLQQAADPAIGMVMGPISGIIDIETDSEKEVEAVRQLFDDCEPLVTVAYQSPRGKHTLYKYDPRLEVLGKATVTYKAAGGQSVTIRLGLGAKATHSVIPPSEGRKWLPGLSPEDCDVAALPELVIVRLLGQQKPNSVSANLRAQNYQPPKADGQAVNDVCLRAMVKATKNMEDTGDGSRRLYTVAMRAVEFDLTDDEAVSTIQAYSKDNPFPRNYSPAEILERVRSGERDTIRGKALVIKRPLTDLGNAERFVDMHGECVRYVHKWKAWLVWNGSRWVEDSLGEVERMAKRTARSIHYEAPMGENETEQREISKWAINSQSKQRLDAMLALAKSEQPIPISPESLDSNPWLLNCTNGTVNLRTGELLPHQPDDLITKTTGVEYPDEPGIDAPLWEDFLHTIFDGNSELIRFVQRLLGSALPGVVREHVLPIFWGGGSNGKGTLLETVMDALGEFAMKAPAGFLMSSSRDRHPTELADLFGKRLVAISETGEGQKLNEQLVKELTGGDTIRARRMRENYWEFPPSHLPIMVTNYKPVIRGTDHGMWRRLKLVPFTVTIPDEEPTGRCRRSSGPSYPRS